VIVTLLSAYDSSPLYVFGYCFRSVSDSVSYWFWLLIKRLQSAAITGSLLRLKTWNQQKLCPSMTMSSIHRLSCSDYVLVCRSALSSWNRMVWHLFCILFWQFHFST